MESQKFCVKKRRSRLGFPERLLGIRRAVPWRARAAVYRMTRARYVNGCSGHGMISFTFDDFPRSALAIGGAALTARGLCATYYASAALAGTDSPMGPMFLWDDLAPAARQGHEIGRHTFRHVAVDGLGPSELLAELAQNGQALEAFAPRNFSYPLGRTDFVAAALLGRHLDSCRGIAAGLNGPRTDLNLLNAVAVYEHLPEETILGWIAEARRQRAWLILYSHDISDRPSPFGCSIGRFERIVAAAHDSAAMVAPVRDCLAELGRNAR